jgi:hypothetical protein
MQKDSNLVAMIAGTLMAGAHPDQIQQTTMIPQYVKLASAIVDESEKQCAGNAPSPEDRTGGGLRNPNTPSPPEGPVTV